LISAADLAFAYDGAAVLHGVSIDVRPGALVGLLGPNGSGKTTLLRLLAGTARPGSGRVTMDGVDMASLSRQDVARRLAVVPQETQLAFEYTVLEIALMGRYPHLGAFELEGPRDVEIAREALAATGTAHLASRRFTTLSGGEKQRVVIASALAQFEDGGAAGNLSRRFRDGDGENLSGRGFQRFDSARYLLLDEPTASLDLHYQLEIAALLRRLNASRGLGIVVSTHDLNLAASLCDELVLLRDGRVVAHGSTRDVLTPASVQALYDVHTDISFHDEAGHLTVVPLRPMPTQAREG